MKSVEELGIEYRETTFANNPKAWHSVADPFRTVARTALGDFRKDGTMFAEFDTGTGEKATRAWKFNATLGMDQVDSIDAWWALHTAVPDIDNAELLLANPHFLNIHYHRPLANRLKRGIWNFTPDKDSGRTSAEYEITSVFSRLRWCDYKMDEGQDLIVGVLKSTNDCYGKGTSPS